MKIVNHEQGSEIWHSWRNQGIGASEAPMILGISTYKTAHKLWQEKTGEIEIKNENNFVFEKGHKIEAQGRAHFELMNDKECPPACMEMDEYPFIRASLDGYNALENFVLEIKYVGKDAMGEVITPHHYAQVQHQMMVSGAKDMLFIRSNDGVVFKSEIVVRDEPYIKDLLEKELAFWKMVQDKVEPPIPEKKPRKKRVGLSKRENGNEQKGFDRIRNRKSTKATKKDR